MLDHSGIEKLQNFAGKLQLWVMKKTWDRVRKAKISKVQYRGTDVVGNKGRNCHNHRFRSEGHKVLKSRFICQPECVAAFKLVIGVDNFFVKLPPASEMDLYKYLNRLMINAIEREFIMLF